MGNSSERNRPNGPEFDGFVLVSGTERLKDDENRRTLGVSETVYRSHYSSPLGTVQP